MSATKVAVAADGNQVSAHFGRCFRRRYWVSFCRHRRKNGGDSGRKVEACRRWDPSAALLHRPGSGAGATPDVSWPSSRQWRRRRPCPRHPRRGWGQSRREAIFGISQQERRVIQVRRRNMYYATGLPGWVRFGYSPGWGGPGPCAQFLLTGQWPTPQTAAWWQAVQGGVTPQSAAAREARLAFLRQQAEMLRQQLEQLQAQIASLESQKE